MREKKGRTVLKIDQISGNHQMDTTRQLPQGDRYEGSKEVGRGCIASRNLLYDMSLKRENSFLSATE